jgi:hypothetical protein
MPVHSTGNGIATSQAGNSLATTNTSSPTRWTNDLPVLAYTGGDKGWRPMPLGQVAKGQEFQFNGHLYYIDQKNGVWENHNVDVVKLTEADRSFDPNQWRYPEKQDTVLRAGLNGGERLE